MFQNSRTIFAASCAIFHAISIACVAKAGELCVTCSGPAASYRCALEGDDPAKPVNPGLQLLCIRELAARGGHTSCSIDRARAAGPCDAPRVTVARPPEGALADVPPQPLADAPAREPAPAPGEAASEKPPATVEELAKASAEQSKKDWDKTNAQVKETTAAAGEKLEKAGNSFGTAIKKSFDCVASLFSHC